LANCWIGLIMARKTAYTRFSTRRKR
jgi:hypothetical protein